MTRDDRYAEEIAFWRTFFVAMLRLQQQMDDELKPVVDLTLLDLGVLFSLSGNGPQPMGELASLFGVDPSVVTYRVARMEKMGYVERRVSPDDGRVRKATLTRKGRGVLGRARTTMLHAARDHFFAFVEPAELPALTRIFEGVLARREGGAEAP